MRRAAAALMAIAALMSSCSRGDAIQLGNPRAQRQATVAAFENGCPELPPLAPVPRRFPPIPFPPGAVSIEPAAQPDNSIRVDLSVPWGVKRTQMFFVRWVKSEGHKLLSLDYEGFEAEVYFRLRTGRIALARVLIGCPRGSIVSVEVFKL